MKKIAIAAIVATFAATSFASVADAAQWRQRGWHNGYHHGWNHRAWRGGWHHGWRHHGWRAGWWGSPFWGGPRIVIGGPAYVGDYCFVKKVRRHDANGNTYIKRVRVCR